MSDLVSNMQCLPHDLQAAVLRRTYAVLSMDQRIAAGLIGRLTVPQKLQDMLAHMPRPCYDHCCAVRLCLPSNAPTKVLLERVIGDGTLVGANVVQACQHVEGLRTVHWMDVSENAWGFSYHSSIRPQGWVPAA